MVSAPPQAERLQTQHEEDIVSDTLMEFQQLQNSRYIFGSHWEEVAELIDPTQRNTFQFGNYNSPGQKKTDRQVDATGMMALSRFTTICNSLVTPSDSFWHGLEADDDYVMRDRATRLWYEQATKIIFRLRYMPEANFLQQNLAKYRSIGAYGNTGLFVDELDPAVTGKTGFRYRAEPLGGLFFHTNHQGVVDGFIRWMRMTARQAKQKWPDTFPSVLNGALDSKSEQLFDFLHRVTLRSDFDPERLDVRGKRFASYHVCMKSRTLLQEGAYRSFPMDVLRYEVASGEDYGRSPAMMILPALKTLNAEKRTFLKQGHRAGDPVLLTADDGLLTPDLTPGATNAGGMSPDGKPLIGILPTGNIQITKEMMDEERSLVNDAFLVSLYQILTETPTMSATEVIERVKEKGILLSGLDALMPSGMVSREMEIALANNWLPPMPPRMREAARAGAVTHRMVLTSPLSKGKQAQEAAGFFRTLEGVKEIVAVTQDPSYLDPFDFDSATRGIANIQSVRESWMADDRKIAQKRKARADAAQRQEMIQAAPAAAAMMKARAATGQGQGGGGTPAAPAQAPAAPAAPLSA
jgi:Bacteriophage head to tail connecting protein